MTNSILPPTTAGIKPAQFESNIFSLQNRDVLIVSLFLIFTIGLFLRLDGLGKESLGEDEFNKLQAVTEYREKGLTGRNGEHPFLMKGLQTASVILCEKWNQAIAGNSQFYISEEAALRAPTAIFGTLTAILLYVLFAELFGAEIGLIAAALWAVDPSAIGFNRIAKEDSFFVFFFILANIFLMKGQTKAERNRGNTNLLHCAAAIAFGGMMASKYMPHFLGVSAAYYNIFQGMPVTKWRLGKLKWFIFLSILGIAFVFFNPTILLPSTWHEILTFSSEKRIGHDSVEYLGMIYRNQFTAWFKGVPWTFYIVFVLVKTPLAMLFFFLIGLPCYAYRKLGDGRYFVLFWFAIGVLSFSFLGGKFTRYFTLAEPLLVVTGAIGIYFSMKFLGSIFARAKLSEFAIKILQTSLFGFVLFSILLFSLAASPHFRLETNWLGGGDSKAGTYFPHDEFYDASTQEIAEKIALTAGKNSVIANETPELFSYYLEKAGRDDLFSVSLSDKTKVRELKAGDIIVIAMGRRYFSNDAYIQYLKTLAPISETKLGTVTSAYIYRLDETSVAKIREIAPD